MDRQAPENTSADEPFAGPYGNREEMLVLLETLFRALEPDDKLAVFKLTREIAATQGGDLPA